MYKIRIGVEGMMCIKCEGHVIKALNDAFAPKRVSASHESHECTMTVKEVPDEQQVRDVITALGYTVTSFEAKKKKFPF
ncbi:MAG: heavy-metal-associated domain-containing protein [Clostridia bacterium]|nr:heavy-metal-associated domain-containing protein [Clostridia bacterium]